MATSTDDNPEHEYADYDAEDRVQPSVPTEIPDDEPENDVLEQRQELGESDPWAPAEIPDDEPENDVLEQRREVAYNEDDE